VQQAGERSPRPPVLDQVLTARLARLIAQHPTNVYPRLWSLLRFHEGLLINRKAVYRVLALKCRGESKSPHLWETNNPHPRVHSVDSVAGTRPALSLSFRR
jgi:hypothetical protein